MSSPPRLLPKILAALAIAAGALVAIELPGTDVPQTAQTLAVLAAGIVLGPLGGATAVVIYLALGALGLPVFSDGSAGFDKLLGPTGGYLVGFVPAAVIAGRATHSRAEHPPGALRLVTAMLLAHVVILALGWARLSVDLGAADAFARGVEPFLIGGAVKSLLAALLALVIVKRGSARSDSTNAST